MSTWQIFSDTDNNFRWEISSRTLPIKPEREHEQNANSIQPHNSDSRLPSMADLLLHGYSKLIENENEAAEATPMFKTGLGKSVSLKQSSIAKALSVLNNDEDDDITVTGEGHAVEKACGYSNSLFQTGSGKIVDISPAGLVRAKTLLGLEEDVEHCNFQGLRQTRTQSTTIGPCGWQSGSNLEMKAGVKVRGIVNVTSFPRPSSFCNAGLAGNKFENELNSDMIQPNMPNSAPKPPPIKFHTAGGRSLSVSSDALQYARSLLGDPELGTFFDEQDAGASDFSFYKEARCEDSSSNKENDVLTPFSHQGTAKNTAASKSFLSSLRLSRVNSENIHISGNLIKKFDAVDHESVSGLNGKMPSTPKPLSNMYSAPNSKMDNSLEDGNCLRSNLLGRSSGKPLADITNRTGTTHGIIKPNTSEKRRLWRNSISPFKRPRSSKFSTPLNKNVSLASGLSISSSENSGCKRTVSSRYPFQIPRMYVKEYFRMPPSAQGMSEHLQGQVRRISSQNADKYMFRDESGLNCIGAETLYYTLTKSGASEQYASKQWVTNHYKWIVWKLACYERCYSAKSAGRFLTVSNVLEELKYRYEREVNNGHRSAIKRILEGDALPSSMMVLCISAIHLDREPKIETHPVASEGVESSYSAKVELTDGWYSVNAHLDVLLSKHLAARKLFVGQKLRIWGAGLCGWVGPVSPLEGSGSVSLLLSINGTYRAHWADRLGFCKGVGAPLAFRCIKSNGGLVPRTLVGVTRIYPVLYKERLSSGGSIVRSERMEAKMTQLYQQRRSILAEGIVSEFQTEDKGSHIFTDSDSEGAKILKILETAAEPEVIMAEMSPEQLTCFTTYQAKLEATRQSRMEKSIEKALVDAGLSERDVTPFMRVRVVGLIGKDSQGKGSSKEGIITIWNPTEKQQCELVEGHAYAITGLVPMNSQSNTLYLQARGSTTKWHPLSPLAMEHFKPFFSPRRSVQLSNLGEVPLSSEFDIAAFVVHVGEVYTDSHQKKQWVFVTDGSIQESQLEELPKSLLAISFSSACVDDDSFLPINYNLVGSTVGYCNLIKRSKDGINHLWVAEATENSTYFLSFDFPNCSHLKSAAASTQSWAKNSSMIIGELKEKVLFIIGECKG